MAKKKAEDTVLDSNIVIDDDFFKDLTKDTEFVLAKDGSLMTARKKIPTPLLVINCIWGGGLPLGTMVEVSGPPASGKSTFAYQTMGEYQNNYLEGISAIYDQESSMDSDRLGTLGVDVNKVLRLPSTSMENSFSNMFKILNKLEKLIQVKPNISSCQIYDTLAAGGTNKQHDSINSGGGAFNAGSMMEAPRIIKQNLSNVFPYIEKVPVTIMFLNQVFTQGVGGYAPHTSAGGGYGLSHNIHAHIVFSQNKDVYENDFLVGTESQIKLEKSKLSPKFINIPCYIDAKSGGRIDEVESFIKYLTKSGVDIISTGSWYNINNCVDYMIEKYPMLKDNSEVLDLKGNIRKNDLINKIKGNKDLLNFLQIRLIDFINEIYPMQADVNLEYKNKIMSECKYFNANEVNLNESTKEVENID